MFANRRYEMIQFLEPWVRVTEYASNLDNELRRETAAGHVLHTLATRAIAQRADNDDVLFEVDSPDFDYAVVHLSWTGEPEHDPRWPNTETFTSIEDWILNRMRPDHERFAS